VAPRERAVRIDPLEHHDLAAQIGQLVLLTIGVRQGEVRRRGADGEIGERRPAGEGGCGEQRGGQCPAAPGERRQR
jgi:hypothetical protein